MIRRNRVAQYRYRKGYTLIELLVVIAIISLLVSIFVPTIQRAKELAREVVCLSNARNIGMVMQYYAQEHDYSLPIPLDQECERNEYYSWPVALGRYITGSASMVNNAFPMSTSYQQESLVEYFQCPTLTGIHPTTKNSYVMNNQGPLDPNCFYNGLNLEMVLDPYCRIAVGEGAYSYQAGGGAFQETFVYESHLGFYHNGGEITGTWADETGRQYEQTDGRGTLLMVDGHAVVAVADEIATDYFTEPYDMGQYPAYASTGGQNNGASQSQNQIQSRKQKQKQRQMQRRKRQKQRQMQRRKRQKQRQMQRRKRQKQRQMQRQKKQKQKKQKQKNKNEGKRQK